MAYSNITFKDLVTRFGMQLSGTHLLRNFKPIPPSAWLQEALVRAKKIGFINEKERSERIVAPVLTELSDLNNNEFIIYSGRDLYVDETLGLNGECDFILSFGTVLEVVQTPIFAITEAKKEDIDGGTVQCAVQLYAAQMLNKSQNTERNTVYGCTTTGEVWRFLKLQGNQLILDEDRYYITQPDQLLGALQQIIDSCKQDV